MLFGHGPLGLRLAGWIDQIQALDVGGLDLGLENLGALGCSVEVRV